MRPGTRVEVRSTFDGTWVSGFEVVGTDEGSGAVTLRRLSDGEVLPEAFPKDAVRRERRRQTWWV